MASEENVYAQKIPRRKKKVLIGWAIEDHYFWRDFKFGPDIMPDCIKLHVPLISRLKNWWTKTYGETYWPKTIKVRITIEKIS